MTDVEKDDLCKGARLVSYDWIVEDIRRIRAKQWKTNDDELYLKELYELRDALQKLDKKKGAVRPLSYSFL